MGLNFFYKVLWKGLSRIMQIYSICKNVVEEKKHIINTVYKVKKKATYVATRTHHFEQVFLEQTSHIAFLLSQPSPWQSGVLSSCCWLRRLSLLGDLSQPTNMAVSVGSRNKTDNAKWTELQHLSPPFPHWRYFFWITLPISIFNIF